MKKIYYFIAFVILSTAMLCSCSDNDSNPDPTPGEKESVDYLVMHYSVGGSDLDRGIISNIMQALDEGSNEKVKMTFQCKLSEPLTRCYPYTVQQAV